MPSRPDTPQPADHRARLGFLLARIGREAWTLFEGVLEPFDLRPRHLVVLMELRAHGATTQGALLDALPFDAATLVALLNHLEAQGLVTRRRDPADRRRHIVETTAEGEKRLAKADRALATAEDELLGALDERQREQFASALLTLERSGRGGAPRRP